MKNTFFIPAGCDQQGRYSTGRHPRSTIEAFNDCGRAYSIEGPHYSTRTSVGVLLLASVCLVALIIAGVLLAP